MRRILQNLAIWGFQNMVVLAGWSHDPVILKWGSTVAYKFLQQNTISVAFRPKTSVLPESPSKIL